MSKPNCDATEPPQCMDTGTLWPFVWSFADDLIACGYTPKSVADRLLPVRHFATWLTKSEITPTKLDGGIVEQFLHHRCECRGPSPASWRISRPSARTVRHLYRFVRFLVEHGVVPVAVLPATQPPIELIDEWVTEFLGWLRRHRSLANATISGYRIQILQLLPALGPDPARYDASLIRRVVIEHAEKRSSSGVRPMTTALRGYLRFLVARGLCRPGIERAVPTIAHWRLSTLPRYLCPADVEKLIASCDLSTAHGVRDHAILLLLARLGLRAGDIVALRLGDIDWEGGTLLVCGKGRRESRLPLPQGVGDALLSYLNDVRPDIASDRIFMRIIAPIKPFERSQAVSYIVHRALMRAEITTPPPVPQSPSSSPFGSHRLAPCRRDAREHRDHPAASLDRQHRPLCQGGHSHFEVGRPALAGRFAVGR